MVFKFFDKKTSGKCIKNKNVSDKELQMNYINQLLENLRKEKYIQLLWTIVGVQA